MFFPISLVIGCAFIAMAAVGAVGKEHCSVLGKVLSTLKPAAVFFNAWVEECRLCQIVVFGRGKGYMYVYKGVLSPLYMQWDFIILIPATVILPLACALRLTNQDTPQVRTPCQSGHPTSQDTLPIRTLLGLGRLASCVLL